jgi:hypothetical protein
MVEQLEGRVLLAAGQSPSSPSPILLPGIIEVEDFDPGGEGVAYHDTEPANLGGNYRASEGVDVQPYPFVAVPFFDHYVGFVKAGEWLNYTVDIAQAGEHEVAAVVSHLRAGGQFHLESDGKRLGPDMTVPNTGSWTRFTQVKQRVMLPAGQHVLRLAFDTNGAIGYVGNFEQIQISSAFGGQTPFKGTPFRGRVEAEDFDSGGEGIAYHDSNPINGGAVYRPDEGVDIQPAGDEDGGFAVGFMKPGEWLEYTINISLGWQYDFGFRVASLKRGGSFHVEVDGRHRASVSVPDTGGWQKWDNVSASFGINAGRHVVRLLMESPGDLGYVMNLNWFTFGARGPLPV